MMEDPLNSHLTVGVTGLPSATQTNMTVDLALRVSLGVVMTMAKSKGPVPCVRVCMDGLVSGCLIIHKHGGMWRDMI